MKFWNDETSSDREIVVNVTSRDGLLNDLEGYLKAGEGFAVATLNLDHVVKLRQNAAFREAYLKQSHVTADGNPVVWLLRIAGRPVELVTGADLVDPVAALAARHGAGVALLGSTDRSLRAAVKELALRHPGFNAVSMISPPMSFDPQGQEAEVAINEIARSGARICFVGLGAPKQEIFVARARMRLPSVGFLSVGAGLDFVSGAQHRAPLIVRRLAAEWLWRLANDPRRLAGRYAACAMSLPALTALAIRSRVDGGKVR